MAMLATKVSLNTLKRKKQIKKTYHSLQELQLSVFEYIEGFYNSKRPHGSLRLLTPNEKENSSGIRLKLCFQQDFFINRIHLLDCSAKMSPLVSLNIFLYFFYICNKFKHISIRITFMRKYIFMYLLLCFMQHYRLIKSFILLVQ